MVKIERIFFNAVPILLMISLIPIIQDDYLLTLTYIVIAYFSLKVKYEKNDFAAILFGIGIMTFCEWIFISTGVETFIRQSLFGVMPIWLPFLWGYSFMAIKRALIIIDTKSEHAISFIDKD